MENNNHILDTVPQRLAALRQAMEKQGLQAYAVYSTDPHGSEYVNNYWRCRTWISGFTGSAGTVVVTMEKAGLWTDGRYFIQAAAELEGSGITLYKEGVPGVPSYLEWLASELPEGSVAGMDGRTLSLREWEAMAACFEPAGIKVEGLCDLISPLWRDRPASSKAEIWEMDNAVAGQSRRDKVFALRGLLKEQGCSATMISSLDDIAWTLNLRGGDVPSNPVVESFLYLGEDRLVWFLDRAKLPQALQNKLEGEGILIKAYEEAAAFLKDAAEELAREGKALFLSDTKTSFALLASLPSSLKVKKGVDPSTRLKACKNRAEQAQVREVMEKDGVALVRFIIWLKETMAQGDKIVTELSAAAVLKALRMEQEGYLDDSFTTIPAYGEHGAICHYDASEASSLRLERQSLFLFDSGGQYTGGTTDVTRTLAMGEASELEKRDYTLVLKGHIALARAVFPQGTRGYQLDTLARMPLWKEGLNYAHGTGHGVGFVLNVHEGPQKISPHPIDEALEPGMICSDEPGVYREGIHGIRIENLVLVQPWGKGLGDEEFYSFETLTLCPYERSLIDAALLTAEEIQWVNDYHKMVYERLSPRLSPSEVQWLREQTLEIA